MRLSQAFSLAAAASSISTFTFLSHVALSSAGANAAQTLSFVKDFVPRIRFRRGFDPRRDQRSPPLGTRSLISFRKPFLAEDHDFNTPGLTPVRPLTMLRGTGLKGGADARKDQGFIRRVAAFCNKRFFLVGAAVVIYAAKLAPSIGATGGLLHPEITVNKAALPLVFFLVGLTIRVGELAGAAFNMKLNLLTQAFSLGVLPAVGWLLAKALSAGGMHPSLCDGVTILMTLPTTVNMCVILTQSAEGNTAAAAFNAVLGNLLGVVVTPALLLLLVGQRLDMALSLMATFKKLAVKVVLPLALGQLARFTPARKIHERRPKVTSRLSECVLLTVLYTTFCDTFKKAAGIVAVGGQGGGGGGGVLALVLVLPVVHLLSIACLDALSRLPFLELTEKDRIAVMYCGSHKTLAFGIPLIKTMFEAHPSLGMLSTPLLLYHPGELLLGSALAPFLRSSASSRAEAGAEVMPSPGSSSGK